MTLCAQTAPTTQGLSLWSVFQHTAVGGEILTFPVPRHSHYSGVISMVFQHSAWGARFSDLRTFPDPLATPTTQGFYPSMVFQHSAEQGTSAPPVSKGFDRVWPGLRHARVDNTRDGFSPITVTSPPPDFRTQWPFPITLSLSDFRIVREPRPEVRAFPLRWVGVRRRDLR